jgi:hypothetical protein
MIRIWAMSRKFPSIKYRRKWFIFKGSKNGNYIVRYRMDEGVLLEGKYNSYHEALDKTLTMVKVEYEEDSRHS